MHGPEPASSSGLAEHSVAPTRPERTHHPAHHCRRPCRPRRPGALPALAVLQPVGPLRGRVLGQLVSSLDGQRSCAVTGCVSPPPPCARQAPWRLPRTALAGARAARLNCPAPACPPTCPPTLQPMPLLRCTLQLPRLHAPHRHRSAGGEPWRHLRKGAARQARQPRLSVPLPGAERAPRRRCSAHATASPAPPLPPARAQGVATCPPGECCSLLGLCSADATQCAAYPCEPESSGPGSPCNRERCGWAAVAGRLRGGWAMGGQAAVARLAARPAGDRCRRCPPLLPHRRAHTCHPATHPDPACAAAPPSQTRRYNWTLEWVDAAPDGFSRPVIAINGRECPPARPPATCLPACPPARPPFHTPACSSSA